MALKTGTKCSETTERPAKDRWDKVDILAKAFIPIVDAGSVLFWNAQKTSRETAAQMITIALSILTAPPEKSAPNALRGWAIDVLRSPEDPPALTDEAAVALSKEAIPWVSNTSDAAAAINEAIELISKFPNSPTPDPP